ncbi:AP endonuclease 1 [Kwoniella heveanensis CBS 569]|nr:AP endonuclease 1 [Kwoniella heveanensis CBS 569]
MPPRQMRPRTSVTSKRERSTSSSSSSDLSDVSAPPSPPAAKPKTTKAKPASKVQAKTTSTNTKTSKVKTAVADDAITGDISPAEANGPLAKKPRVAKGKAWPPPEIAPELHPARCGHPVYCFPSTTSVAGSEVGNGGLPSLSKNLKQPMLLGAHVSIAGGPATALLRAGMAGANGLAMFTKSQRQWKSNPYEDEAIQRFRDLMKSKDEGGLGYGPESILVHGSYLINLGNPDPEKWKTSYECFKDDIYRCHQLGIKLYNWHPGSTVGACTKEESFTSIAKAINMVHKEVPEVICVIENMASAPLLIQANAGSNIVGTAFRELAAIIAQVEDKSRVRVCLDTCHLFAAGYDLRTQEAYKETMKKFEEEVGNGYLGGIHLNDSKADLGGNKDLHENIGLGKIGLTGFRCLMRDPLMAGIPLVLETPAPEKALEVGDLAIWQREIKLLYEIQGIEDEEWEKRKGEIEERWRKERDSINPPKEKGPKGKGATAKGGKAKPAAKGKGKKGKKAEETSDEEDD